MASVQRISMSCRSAQNKNQNKIKGRERDYRYKPAKAKTKGRKTMSVIETRPPAKSKTVPPEDVYVAAENRG
jgi:hypothetical protein